VFFFSLSFSYYFLIKIGNRSSINNPHILIGLRHYKSIQQEIETKLKDEDFDPGFYSKGAKK
jgi:hypothetical protein